MTYKTRWGSVLGLFAGLHAATVMAVPMLILADTFETYVDQTEFESAWSEDGTTTYHLDTDFGAGGGQSVKLEPVPSGNGTSNRWFRDLGGTFNGSDAKPLIFSYDLFLHPDGAQTLWANTFDSCDVRGYTDGGYKLGELQDLISVGVVAFNGYQVDLYQARTIAGSVFVGNNGYLNLDASTAPDRLPGWHHMEAVVSSDTISFRVDGQLAGEVPWGLPFGINSIVIGTGVPSNHTVWVDNVKLEIIPEPSTLIFSLLGLVAVGISRRRNSRA